MPAKQTTLFGAAPSVSVSPRRARKAAQRPAAPASAKRRPGQSGGDEAAADAVAADPAEPPAKRRATGSKPQPPADAASAASVFFSKGGAAGLQRTQRATAAKKAKEAKEAKEASREAKRKAAASPPKAARGAKRKSSADERGKKRGRRESPAKSPRAPSPEDPDLIVVDERSPERRPSTLLPPPPPPPKKQPDRSLEALAAIAELRRQSQEQPSPDPPAAAAGEILIRVPEEERGSLWDAESEGSAEDRRPSFDSALRAYARSPDDASTEADDGTESDCSAPDGKASRTPSREPSPTPPPTVRAVVGAVADHVGAAPWLDSVIVAAAEAAIAAAHPTQQCPLTVPGALRQGSAQHSALREYLRRQYASCLLKRAGVQCSDYEQSLGLVQDPLVPESQNECSLWVRTYAPSCSHEAVVPASFIAAPQPRVARQLRSFLIEWQRRLSKDDLGFSDGLNASSLSVVCCAAAVAAGTSQVAARAHRHSLAAVLVLQRVIRGGAVRGRGENIGDAPPRRRKQRTSDAKLWEGFLEPRRRRPPRSAAFTEMGSSHSSSDGEQARVRHVRGRRARERRKRDRFGDARDSSVSSGSGADTHAFLARALVVRGAAGTGVTASVHACAREAGFEVVEIDTSRRRSREAVLQYFREATQSRKICGMASAAVSPSPPPEPPAKRKAPAKRGRSSAKRSRKAGEAERSGGAAAVVGGIAVLTTAAPTAALPLRRRPQSSHLLLLFESADVVFSDEHSFHAALRSLVDESRCPIVITCNTLTPPLRQLCRGGDAACVSANAAQRTDTAELLPPHASGKWPGFVSLSHLAGSPTAGLGPALHLSAILLAEGVRPRAPSLNALLTAFRYDLRGALNTCQLWFQDASRRVPKCLWTGSDGAAETSDHCDQTVAVALLGLRPAHAAALSEFTCGRSSARAVAGSTPLTNSALFACRLADDNYLRLLDSDALPPPPPPPECPHPGGGSNGDTPQPYASLDSFPTAPAPANTFTLSRTVSEELGPRCTAIAPEEDSQALFESPSAAPHRPVSTLPAVPRLFPQAVGSQGDVELFSELGDASPQLHRAASVEDSIRLCQLLPATPSNEVKPDYAEPKNSHMHWRSAIAGCPATRKALRDPATLHTLEACATYTLTASVCDTWHEAAVRAQARPRVKVDNGTQQPDKGPLSADGPTRAEAEWEGVEADSDVPCWHSGIPLEWLLNTCSALALRRVVQSPAGRSPVWTAAAMRTPRIVRPRDAYCTCLPGIGLFVAAGPPPSFPESAAALCGAVLSHRRQRRKQRLAQSRLNAGMPVADRVEYCMAAVRLWRSCNPQEPDEPAARRKLRQHLLSCCRAERWSQACAAAGAT
eukprot:TRINITY_DN9758_c0_g1_i1.p1 TRINITY_DN9758_c0_g1~~TRINITY_DN9758_c0_g1_i1.p1  ORF type:complete len:1366 (+),score=378.94 TRINITY_DN9758_c0_g1_i1:54-4100(+)